MRLLFLSELADHMVRSRDSVSQRRPPPDGCLPGLTPTASCLCSCSREYTLSPSFLPSPPSLPPPQIILTRRSEVLQLECELSEIHFLLSKLPPDLSYEQMIMLSQQLYKKHPPSALIKGFYELRSRSEVGMCQAYKG